MKKYPIVLALFTLLTGAAGAEAEYRSVVGSSETNRKISKQLAQRAEAVRANVFSTGNHQGLPYRLFRPKMGALEQEYPLVIFLHGGQGRGRDNRKQLQGGNRISCRVWVSPQNQREHPCFVLAPQCPTGDRWGSTSAQPSDPMRKLVSLLNHLRKTLPIDPTRLYVTGLSLGGFGTWDLISRHPRTFAAAIPICGRADPRNASKLVDMPLWIFHGDADPRIPVEMSRKMFAALKRAGSKNVRYWEYAKVGHSCWNRAYTEPALMRWLFSNRLRKD